MRRCETSPRNRGASKGGGCKRHRNRVPGMDLRILYEETTQGMRPSASINPPTHLSVRGSVNDIPTLPLWLSRLYHLASAAMALARGLAKYRRIAWDMQLLRMNPAQRCRGNGFQPSGDPIPQSNRRRLIRGVNMVMRCQSYIIACNYPNAAPRGERVRRWGSIEIEPPHLSHFSGHPAPVSPNRLATVPASGA